VTFDLNGATEDVTNLVVVLDGSQQVFMSERGKTEGASPWTFAHLSNADLAAVAAAKTIDVHMQGQPTGASYRVDGTAAALKALADYCARGEWGSSLGLLLARLPQHLLAHPPASARPASVQFTRAFAPSASNR
jgi:hypothetical protein